MKWPLVLRKNYDRQVKALIDLCGREKKKYEKQLKKQKNQINKLNHEIKKQIAKSNSSKETIEQILLRYRPLQGLFDITELRNCEHDNYNHDLVVRNEKCPRCIAANVLEDVLPKIEKAYDYILEKLK